MQIVARMRVWETGGGGFYKIHGVIAKFQVPFMGGGENRILGTFFGQSTINHLRGCKTKKSFGPSAEKNTVVDFFFIILPQPLDAGMHA